MGGCTYLSRKKMRIMHKLNTIASTGRMSYQHAAGLLKHGKLVDISVNSHRSKYTLNGTSFLQCSLHAELAVLRKLVYHLGKNNKLKMRKMRKYELVVIRKNYSNSLPCKHCMQVIKHIGITKVCYSNGDVNKRQAFTKARTRDLKSDHQSRAVVMSTSYLTN